MDFQELIRVRRSVRSYQPDEIADDVLERVLSAARVAPTACNRQPFQLILVTDASARQSLGAAYPKDWLAAAPAIIVGCVDPAQAWQRNDGFNSAEVDLAIAMDHIILAATEEGLGSCWVCAFDETKAKQALGIPNGVRVIAMTPLGYPAGEPGPFARKPLRELVRRNRW